MITVDSQWVLRSIPHGLINQEYRKSMENKSLAGAQSKPMACCNQLRSFWKKLSLEHASIPNKSEYLGQDPGVSTLLLQLWKKWKQLSKKTISLPLWVVGPHITFFHFLIFFAIWAFCDKCVWLLLYVSHQSTFALINTLYLIFWGRKQNGNHINQFSHYFYASVNELKKLMEEVEKLIPTFKDLAMTTSMRNQMRIWFP